MKRNALNSIGGTALMLLVITTLTSGIASAQNGSQSRSGGGRLEGTWEAQVTIRDCQTGADLRTFASVATFMSGGTMIDSTSGTPQALKTPGHGVWSHAGDNTYRFKFKSFSFDAAGNFTGWTVISHEAHLDQGADEFQSAGTAEVYAPNGNLIFTGCSTTTSTRFK